MLLDELVVKLSLDPTAFNAGTKQGQDLLRKFKEEVKKTGTDIERDAGKMADGFSRVTKEILGLGLALAGANSLKNLVVGTLQTAAAFNVASRALDVNEVILNKWTNTARRAGSGAEAFGAFKSAVVTLGGVTTGLIKPQQAGQQALATLGIDNPAWNDPDKFFKAIVQGFQTKKEVWPGQFAALSQQIPAGPELLLIAKANTTMAKLDETLRDSATLTHEQAEAARETTQKVEEVRQAIEKQTNKLIPLVAPAANEALSGVKSLVEGDPGQAAQHAANTPLAWPFLPMLKLFQGEVAVGKMVADWWNQKTSLKDRFVFGQESGEGSTYYGMPMPPPRPRMTGERQNERYPGLGPASSSGTYQGWPSAGHGADMSRTININQVSLMVPPGKHTPEGFGDSFLGYISMVDANNGLR